MTSFGDEVVLVPQERLRSADLVVVQHGDFVVAGIDEGREMEVRRARWMVGEHEKGLFMSLGKR